MIFETLIIVDRQDYMKKTNNILSDQTKFTIVNLRDNILLNISVNHEKQVDKVLKNVLSVTVW